MAFALALFAAGSLGRIALLGLPNVETVTAVALLAGCLLGGREGFLVPIAVVAATDAYVYGTQRFALTLAQIGGVTFFVWSGFAIVAAIGRLMKRGARFSPRFVGVLTGAGLFATAVYQVWVNVGWWWVMYPHTARYLALTFALAAPFALRQYLSTLLFVPLLATPFLYAWERLAVEPIAVKAPIIARARRKQQAGTVG